MPRHIEMQNSPAVVGNHEEAVEGSKPESGNREEVHGSYGFTMILEECLPVFSGFRVLTRPLYASREKTAANFSADGARSPVFQ